MIEYVNKKMYAINTFDNDNLDEYSEFPIGSVTKLFTMISLLLLHQNKQINIFDNIGKYIDNNEIKDLKIIDIINHKSGFKNWWNGAVYGGSKIKYTSATEIYDKWNDNNLIDMSLKDKEAYSNMGYIILGYLIEKITNMNYSNFIKRNIIKPLKMKNTGITDCNITLYDYKLKKLNKYQKQERNFAIASGELKSCIKDLIKFSNFIKLLNEDTINLLKEFSVFKEFNSEFMIQKGGNITGGDCKLSFIYDNKWKIKDIYISLQTG